ncbi:hypothetical protein BU23DRAFT_551265 [Bimuria novae-zelandiae CBS 107.79]|uniref:Rhodopsin domain-containing protein n=1 Tax=Bimuria novae-zelandiae CBS 107.79 TaxID=1447943 RepID=A0A6A5VUB2_9PLEO|nr:hypothetical protein BU23DRAFT_551265 [Bimuria novae-zelandiae CBS 107.79]
MHTLQLGEVIATAWSLTILALLTTLGRFAIHWHRRQRIAWDDFFNGLAMVFLLAFTGTYQVYGPADYTKQLFAMGLIKEDEVIQSDRKRDARYNAANTLLFWCAIYAAKASFLALYWHVFAFSTKFRIAWAATTAYIPASFAVTFMWSFFLCGDPKYFPDTQPYCHENAPARVGPMLAGWCALDLIGDILLAALPLAMLRPLLMKTSQKMELAVIFLLVVINMVMTILRTVYSVDINLARFPDQNILWCFLQVSVAVIVCALPCYRGILMRTKSKSLPGGDQNSSEAEFADIWQRYLISIGEHKDGSRTDPEKVIEAGDFSGPSGTRTRVSEDFRS